MPVVVGDSSDTQTEIISGVSEGDDVVTGILSSSNSSSSASPFGARPFGGIGGGGGGGIRVSGR